MVWTSQYVCPILTRLRQTGVFEAAGGTRPAYMGVATSDDDAEKAEFWLENTIQVFDEISLSLEECIKCVVSLLKDAAYQWWKTLISIIPKERKRKGFLELKQGRMSVTKHEREFVRLSQYAREVSLNEDIRLLIGILEIKEFVVLVDRACKAEALGKDKRKVEFESTSKKFIDEHSRSRTNVGHSNPRDRARSQSNSKAPATLIASVGNA
ncbi:Gag-Pol polyprotein [Gossypium australe]|uniref:Gag-Pol polyprotein n=1 Tax=Gossypium australe TaxID=47621 RepID=A0A5B6WS33_9ROSI|nr:Gag-Pol polyprotein [Gossypium australe]